MSESITQSSANKSASEYAKSRVQQIRKKFGYPNSNKENNLSSAVKDKNKSIDKKWQAPTSDPHLALLRTDINALNFGNNSNKKSMKLVDDMVYKKQCVDPKIAIISKAQPAATSNSLSKQAFMNTAQNKIKGLGSVGLGLQMKQYEDRIKNIDNINKKIMQMLNQNQQKNSNQTKEGKNQTNSKQTIEKKTNQQQLGIETVRNKAHERRYSVTNNRNIYAEQSKQKQKTLKNITKDPLVNEKASYGLSYKRQNIGLGLGLGAGLNTSISRGLDFQNTIAANTIYTVSIQLPSNSADPSEIKVKQKQVKVEKQLKNAQILQNYRNDKKMEHLSIQLKERQQKIQKQRQKEKLQEISRKQTIRLAQILSEQISLDQKLRYSKWLFMEWTITDKWTALQQKWNPRQPLQQVKKLFTLSSDEQNPFFQNNDPITQKCIDDLIQNYKQANSYWKQSVNNCVTVKDLQKQFFNVKDLDLAKKGHLSIEDLVCFVNLYTGKFFRNRDVISLFKRFLGNRELDVLKYQYFLDQITK